MSEPMVKMPAMVALLAAQQLNSLASLLPRGVDASPKYLANELGECVTNQLSLEDIDEVIAECKRRGL